MRIGVISDTHGLLRPEALSALSGVELILHAGDVDRPEILDALRRVAPVSGVRGNVDRGAWASHLPLTDVVATDGGDIYMLHDLGGLDLDPVAAGIAAVVYGHSHRHEVRYQDGVLYLNPGSAGPRRFDLPVTLALLDATPAGLAVEILDLL